MKKNYLFRLFVLGLTTVGNCFAYQSIHDGWKVIEHNGIFVEQNVEWVILKKEVWVFAGENSAPVMFPLHQHSCHPRPYNFHITLKREGCTSVQKLIYKLKDDQLTLKTYKEPSSVPLKNFDMEPNADMMVLERIKTKKIPLHKLVDKEAVSEVELLKILEDMGSETNSVVPSMMASLTNISEKVCLELLPRLNQNDIHRLAQLEFISDAVLSAMLEYSSYDTARYISRIERSSPATKTKALDRMVDVRIESTRKHVDRRFRDVAENPLTSEETLWKLVRLGGDAAENVLENEKVTEAMVVEMVKIRGKGCSPSRTLNISLHYPLRIQGVPCSKSITFNPSGKLIRATLVEDFFMNDVVFPAGSTLRFYASGKVKSAFLKKGTDIQGLPCNEEVKFFESGKISRCHLERDTEIQGIVCVLSVSFYESGALKRAYIRKDQNVRGVACSGGQYLDFLEFGALRITPSAKAHHDNAKTLHQAGKLKEALSEINQALEQSTDYTSAFFTRGAIKQSLGDLEGAHADLNRVLELDPKSTSARHLKAKCYWLQSDWNKVIEYCTESIERHSGNASIFYLRALARQRSGDEGVTSDLIRSRESSWLGGWCPQRDIMIDNHRAWFFATASYEPNRDGERSLSLAKKNIKLERSGVHFDTLAAAYAEVGDFKKAVKMQKKAISITEKEEMNDFLKPFKRRLRCYERGDRLDYAYPL